MLGVDPVFGTYPGGYAYSVNSARRHLLKGQLAVIAVQASQVFRRMIKEDAAAEAGRLPISRTSWPKVSGQ